MNSSNETCTLQSLDSMIAALFVPLIQVILNLVVTVAAVRSRSKLRNNYVYMYVVSMLTANIVFGLFAFYLIANRAFTFEEVKLYVRRNPEDRHQQRWWAMRNSVVMSMFLVMSANVSSLIYGLRESSYFVGPGAAAVAQRKDRCPKSIRQKRNKAIVIVTTTWLAPLVLVVATVSGWNCVSRCSCHGQQADWQELCHKKPGDGCSRTTPPLTTLFQLIIAILWFFLAIGIGVMLWTTVRKFEEVSKPDSSHENTEDVEFSGQTNVENRHHNISATDDTTQDNKAEDKVKITCCNSARLNYTIRLMLVISVLFVVCSLPTIIIMVLDFASEIHIDANAATINYVLSLFYCIVTPVLLVVYMPSLRQAVIDLSHLCTCCTTTVVRSGDTPSHVTSN